MTAEIIKFTGITSIPESPEITLEKAKHWNMDRCLILGWHTDGQFMIGGSFSEMGEMLILLEKAKQHLMASI